MNELFNNQTGEHVNTTDKTYRSSSRRIGRQGLRQDLADLRCSLRIDGHHLGKGGGKVMRGSFKQRKQGKIGEAAMQQRLVFVCTSSVYRYSIISIFIIFYVALSRL